MVADPQLPEPEGAQRRLGRLDGGQAAECDRRAVGQARGQAAPRRACPRCATRAGATQRRMSSLVKPASTSGKAAPAAAAAACPGRWSPRSSRLTPSTTVAPSAAASGPTASMRAVLQRAQRSGPLATYAASSISPVGTPTQRRSHSLARARQSASSAPANDGESAVTQSTESLPSASWATLARSEESAPPLNATTTRPSRRSALLRSSSEAAPAVEETDTDEADADRTRAGR